MNKEDRLTAYICDMAHGKAFRAGINKLSAEQVATALYKAGYRKRTMMDRDKLAKLIDEFLTKNEDGYYCEQFADYLIANGIGDVTAEKHRADVAEEALRLAFEEWTCCDSCMFSVDCKTNRTDCKKAEISKIKQQAEAGKIVIVKEEK